VLKIPMQFMILFTGVMVYVFYLFYAPPVHFKQASIDQLKSSKYATEYDVLNQDYESLIAERKTLALDLATVAKGGDGQSIELQLQQIDTKSKAVREQVKDLIVKMDPALKTKDSDYIFLSFILTYLPHGLIGLLIAVIFSAAMSSSSSELNALSSTTTIDFYKRLIMPKANKNEVLVSKGLTILWGILAVSFAMLASNSENLIEAVNIVGSIFYGTILAIFLVAFFIKSVKGTAIFWATLIAQVVVIVFHFLATYEVITLGYLWYNAIGCVLTIVLSLLIQIFQPKETA
ncbi:MAG: Na+(H+)/acetate symporter ActP, partial [Flavobacteriaceae bacterium]